MVWFGNLSYSKLKLEKEPDNSKCPCCSGELRPIIHDGLFGYEPPPETEIEIWCDPEGWSIEESNQEESIQYVKSSRHNRKWNRKDGLEGIGSMIKNEPKVN